MKRRIRIAIAEDHNVVRQGMLALFEDREDIKVVFDVANGVELLDNLKQEIADVILLDLNMPILSGEEALKVIAKKYPAIRVIIISMHSGLDYIKNAISNGANGFLRKEEDFETILEAIHAVHQSGYYFNNVVTEEMISELKNEKQPENDELIDPISPKDIRIIQLICEGKTNKEIAELIFTSVRTVEGRRLNIPKKTGAKTVGDLVVYAIKQGIYQIN